MKTYSAAACALILSLLPVAGRAEIAVSANDGKALSMPDSVSVLDIQGSKLRLLGSVAAPASMVGPPRSAAMTADGHYAIVAACQTLSGGKAVSSDNVSVIDLSKPAQPRLVQSAHAGPGATSVSISPNGKLVLVANTDGNSISVFSFSGGALTKINDVPLGDKTTPTDAIFTRDGKTVVAVARGVGTLMFLSVNGTHVSVTDKSVTVGREDYGAVITRDGKYAINTNLGGAPLPPGSPPSKTRGVGTITMTDIASAKVVASVEVGTTPEHVALSDDGKYVAVVVGNGAATTRTDPKFDSVFGLLEIYAVGDGTLKPVTRSPTGHWCQGATFSKDDKTILLQCAAEQEIEVYHFNGTDLVQDKNATVPMTGSRPGAIITARANR